MLGKSQADLLMKVIIRVIACGGFFMTERIYAAEGNRTSTLRSAQLVETTLPPDAPPYIVLTPTMNRWQKKDGSPGHLPNMTLSVQRALGNEGLNQDAWMLVADASSDPEIDRIRLQNLALLDGILNPARLFLLTNETQQQVREAIAERTGIRADIIDAVLIATGYGSQREKLDMAVRGLSLASERPIKALTLDDDTLIPKKRVSLELNALPLGLSQKPNSQTLLSTVTNDMLATVGGNTIRPFFDPLGKTIAQLREQYPDLQATYGLKDTMRDALGMAAEGKPAQFEVTHTNEDEISGDAEVIGVTGIKHGVPDYPTPDITRLHYQKEFPDKEMPISAWPSGPNEPFAFKTATTNVDSACLSRLFDDKTVTLPWWHISSRDISARNPLKTVDSPYRSDNDLLPRLLEVISQQTGQEYMYLSGIETQVHHDRARTGYRPDLHEQSIAAFAGIMTAGEAIQRLYYDRNHDRIRMRRVEDDYLTPLDRSKHIYDRMKELASACEKQMGNLSQRKVTARPEEVGDINKKNDEFLRIYGSIFKKLGNFNFEVFYYHLGQEVHDQLNFFADVLDAMPAVITEIQRLIEKGQYPVVEYYAPRRDRTRIARSTVIFEDGKKPTDS